MSAEARAARGPADAAAAAWHSPIDGALWLRTWRLGEWLDGPVSPLFESFLLPVLADARERGGNRRFGWRMPRMFRMRRPAYCVLNGYYFARAEPAPLSVALLPPRFLATEIRGGWLARFWSLSLPAYAERLRRHAVVPLEDGPALLRSLGELALDVAELWYALGLATGGAVPLQKFLSRASGGALSEADALALIGGFETPATTEQQSLWQLAQALAATAQGRTALDEVSLDEILAGRAPEPALAEWGRALAAHLARFGHQVRSFDFIHPCLAEEPSRLGASLRCYLEPQAREPRQALAEAAAIREALRERALAGISPGKRKLFARLLARAQGYARTRDEVVSQIQQAWPLFRRGFLALGSGLAGQGLLASPADVFFLTGAELGEAVARGRPHGAGKVEPRRRLWHKRRTLAPPASIPAGTDPAWTRAATWPIRLRFDGMLRRGGLQVLEGTGASPGRVRARARVLGFASEQDRLAAGEVLVTVATTPDWTPLFALASAVVTDVGGTASHSSIVAREYRIPAVVGTREATRRIRDGELVTVDGNEGRVYLADLGEGGRP